LTRIDWDSLPVPFLAGDARFAYRDPAAVYHEGIFRVFHTLVERESDGECYWYLGVTQSTDLLNWTEPRRLTPRNHTANWSSPGNVVRDGDDWVMCLQTYPTPNGERRATQDARIFTMRSTDLESWDEPELLAVKGPDVAREDMGRMIDPYLVRDKDDSERWWCFFKQRGASISTSRDLRTWRYHSSVEAGENACVIVDDNGEYVLIHSPHQGIGMKRSSDLIEWRDAGTTTLGQDDWEWAQGRLTAAQVLDLRSEPGIERYLMFFHGSTPAGAEEFETHGDSSLGLCWSDDLTTWHWPGGNACLEESQ
jgi:hypothetical protein